MNCRDCANWSVKETLEINPGIAKQGFAKCMKAQGQKKIVFFSAGYFCNEWAEASEAAIQKRKEIGAY